MGVERSTVVGLERPDEVGPIGRAWAWLNQYPLLPTILGTFLALVLLTAIMAFASEQFLSTRNIRNIFTQASVYVVLGVGMTFVLNTGGIDISMGSALGLATSVMGTLIIAQDLAPWLGVLGCLAVGTLCGVFNALMIVVLKVPPIITTLGTWTAFRGLAFVHLEGTIHYGFPDAIVWFGRGVLLGIPVPIWLALVSACAGGYLLRCTRFGRYTTAIGGNEDAARIAGINVALYRGLVYVLAGFLAGVAGLIVTARLDAAQATTGIGMELHTLASVVIGGTALFGGRSTMIGTVLGVLILQVLENGLLLAGVSNFWQRVGLGLIVIAAVAMRTYRDRSPGSML
jgi:ribose/xylose/arabinose/galactoside ABC-type transport system permease subunit